jgi:diacylglycerol kinase
MLQRHTISFKNAFAGIVWALSTQPNYRIHIISSLLALVLSYVCKISYFEFLIVLLLIIIGLVIEMVNTSIEAATDAIDTKWRHDIKITKDTAAAAMLIFAIGALMISCVIFVPKIAFALFHIRLFGVY